MELVVQLVVVQFLGCYSVIKLVLNRDKIYPAIYAMVIHPLKSKLQIWNSSKHRWFRLRIVNELKHLRKLKNCAKGSALRLGC